MDRGEDIFGTGMTSADFQMGGINPSRIEAISDMLLRFETRAVQRRLVSRIEAKFCTFWHPVKIREVICEMFPCHFVATPRT